VVDGPGQHARELRLADARLERLDLRDGVALRRLVVLGNAELEVLARIGELFFDLGDEIDRGFDLRALAQDLLCLGLIAPKIGNARPVVQLAQPPLEARDVKDAPLAPRGAF
jgi:hypothetical protein